MTIKKYYIYNIIIYILILDDILYLNKKYNTPGAQNLFLLAKSEGIQTTLKDVQTFISGRTEEHQGFSNGHIVSYSLFHRLQLNIFVFKKYEYFDKEYGYILCIIDVFSRKVWAFPLKTKFDRYHTSQ
jgi:hypothetical protein